MLSGCLFPLDGGEDDFECEDLPTRALRDPQTGTCTRLGYVGDRCAACGSCAPDPVDTMDRAECGTASVCEGLSEPKRLEEAGCRTAYALDDGHFLGCWGMAPSGAGDGHPCAGLDASACSRRRSCAAWYVTSGGGQPTAFDHCGDAPPAGAGAGG